MQLVSHCRLAEGRMPVMRQRCQQPQEATGNIEIYFALLLISNSVFFDGGCLFLCEFFDIVALPKRELAMNAKSAYLMLCVHCVALCTLDIDGTCKLPR